MSSGLKSGVTAGLVTLAGPGVLSLTGATTTTGTIATMGSVGGAVAGGVEASDQLISTGTVDAVDVGAATLGGVAGGVLGGALMGPAVRNSVTTTGTTSARQILTSSTSARAVRTGSESCFRCTWFYRYDMLKLRQLEVLSGRKLTLPLEQLIVPQLLLRRDQEPRRVLLLVLLCQPQRTRPLKLSINDLQAGGMKTDKPITTSIWAVLIVSAFSIVVVAFFGSQIVQYHKSEITQGQVVAIDYPKVIVSYDDRINGPRNGNLLGRQ